MVSVILSPLVKPIIAMTNQSSGKSGPEFYLRILVSLQLIVLLVSVFGPSEQLPKPLLDFQESYFRRFPIVLFYLVVSAIFISTLLLLIKPVRRIGLLAFILSFGFMLLWYPFWLMMEGGWDISGAGEFGLSSISTLLTGAIVALIFSRQENLLPLKKNAVAVQLHPTVLLIGKVLFCVLLLLLLLSKFQRWGLLDSR